MFSAGGDLNHAEIRRPEAFIMTPVWSQLAVLLCFRPLWAWEIFGVSTFMWQPLPEAVK
jgi:hypothetical protein